jgi:hypothetical protein
VENNWSKPARCGPSKPPLQALAAFGQLQTLRLSCVDTHDEMWAALPALRNLTVVVLTEGSLDQPWQAGVDACPCFWAPSGWLDSGAP